MVDNIKVLVWGHVEEGPCAYFRGHMFKDELLKRGIEYKGLSRVDFEVTPEGTTMTLPEAFAKGHVKIDGSQVDWADVVIFRRYYNTTLQCKTCMAVTFNYHDAVTHEHGPMQERDVVTRLIWPVFQHANHNKAIIYETDDDHFNIKSWNGYSSDARAELPLIEEMAKRADLITTSTPVIANRYARFNDDIRVIRNALDLSLYRADTERPDTKQRLVYYGNTARLRDYIGFPVSGTNKIEGGYAAKAVQDLQANLHRIFLGVSEGTDHQFQGLFDETIPYVEGIPEFCRALANTHPDIGIAPVLGDDFDQAKSELHWMEYSALGAATIATKYRGGSGPYDVIRDGVDGLLARTRQEWYDQLKKLVKNPNMAKDIGAAAKERIFAEYDHRKRADEWADAIRWAVENKGKKVRVA